MSDPIHLAAEKLSFNGINPVPNVSSLSLSLSLGFSKLSLASLKGAKFARQIHRTRKIRQSTLQGAYLWISTAY